MLCAFLVFTKCFLFLYHCCILSEIKLSTATTISQFLIIPLIIETIGEDPIYLDVF